MRTSKRHVNKNVNVGKIQRLQDIIHAYTEEKRFFLKQYFSLENGINLKKHRLLVASLEKYKYKSKNKVSARIWKLALKEAAETWDKYWQSSFVKIRSKIAKNKNFTDEQRHYINWLLSNYNRFYNFYMGKLPINTKIDLNQGEQHKTARKLKRMVDKLCKNKPTLKQERSIVLDSSCYSVFTKNNIQYIGMVSLEPYKRIFLPLTGISSISGNIRVINNNNHIEIHQSHAFKKKLTLADKDKKPLTVVAIDKGYTEVAVDNNGHVYGKNFGQLLTSITEDRKVSLQRRQYFTDKIDKLNEKIEYFQSLNPEANVLNLKKKIKNIWKNNLGEQTRIETKRKQDAQIENVINRSLNDLIQRYQDPEKHLELVVEDLRHAFNFNYLKTQNRKLNSWVKGVVRKRIEFKAQAECFYLTEVNSAYTSQMCPICGYVHKDNRKGDIFVCLKCKASGHADKFAAVNIKFRRSDNQISLYTPYKAVKALIETRYSSC